MPYCITLRSRTDARITSNRPAMRGNAGYPVQPGSPGYEYQGDAGISAQPASPSYGYLSSPLYSPLRFRLCLSPVALSRQSASED